MKFSPWAIKTIIISALIIIAAFFITGYLSWSHYQGRIYPGTWIGGLDLGGKTLDEARGLLSEHIKKIELDGLKFQYNGKSSVLSTTIASFDSDLSYSAVSFDLEETLSNAYGNKSERNFPSYLWRILFLPGPNHVAATYSLNDDAVKSFLADNFPELNINPENAYFSTANSKNGQLKLSRNLERPGKEINYGQALEEIKMNLDNLQNNTILIRTRSKYPSVKQSDLDLLEPEIQAIVGRGSLILRRPENDNSTSTEYWVIKPDHLITWASVQSNSGRLELNFDLDKIKEYLRTVIAPEIDREAILPRFEIKDGRVTSWQTGKNGRALDLEASASAISNSLLAGKNEISLIIKDVTAENLNPENDLSIKEIIGTGHSKFTGSPANRRHNIAVGAAALHGLLIKPNEEFSLIKTLGDVSDKTGYLPELVIKGNKTIPEFGGGLCQIGTTIFRTALASGLPITMRQNHSYRVSYYEPAGTDATIYIPQPDLRFINDTGNYILIQARIIKDDLYFDFWGTKDGRTATTTDPIIYNIVKPEPTKIIESEDLKPGEKKCTESSHNGADAYFDYKVVYPEGATSTPTHERRFKSHYIPWQGVCLIGKTASSTASSTLENIRLSNEATSTSPNQKAADLPAASSSDSINH